MDDIGRIMRLFRGFEGAHGTYRAEDRNPAKGGKLEIKRTAETLREDVTRMLWEQHVAGKRPLGVIPIRADNTCYWACIDVDRYDVSHGEIAETIRKRSLPLVVCRSKSGGAHIFVFAKQPIEAERLQMWIRQIATTLGLGNCEIFPKQTKILAERGDLGNWLNMPYYGGDETDRYGVKPTGAAMTLGEFVRVARASLVTEDDLVVPKQEGTVGDLEDGPPCLEYLISQRFGEGHRNNGLFAVGVYCRKKYGQKWAEKLEEYNRRFVQPPLGASEMKDLIRNVGKKDYHYRCSDEPLVSHCNSALCRIRKFGVGDGGDYPVISGLSVLDTEPPLWFLDIDGERLEMDTDDLQTYRRFHKICMEKLLVCYPPIQQNIWFRLVSAAMRDTVKIDAPPEVSISGQFLEHLEDFLVNKFRGLRQVELLMGKPWSCDEEQKHYFRLRDLQEYLENHGFKSLRRAQITTRIRRLGGDKAFMNIEGKGVNVWWVPAHVVQTTPEIAPREMKKDPI